VGVPILMESPAERAVPTLGRVIMGDGFGEPRLRSAFPGLSPST